MAIGNDDVGLQFINGGKTIRGFNMATNARADAAVDLGMDSTRFKDLYLSGGVYLGGTGSANELSDYEEGTFSPTFTLGGGSMTVDSSEDLCSYTKIGRLVTVAGRIKVGSISSPSSFIIVTNLPFTVTNLGEQALSGAVACNLYDLASSITGAINAEMHSQGILIRDNGSTTGGVTNIADKFDDGSRIGFTASYVTTD